MNKSAISASIIAIFGLLAIAPGGSFSGEPQYDYRVLATTKTSTMEKELNQAAEDGFVFAAVMGGETTMRGSEAVVVMVRSPANPPGQKRTYRLLATSKTSTMQKEMQQLGAEGFEYKGQTVFETTFGGHEVCVIMEGDTSQSRKSYQYRLLATRRTSTMQKELEEAGNNGFRLAGLTVARTAFGGDELVCILQKETR